MRHATSIRTQEPAGGDDKSLGRNRTGGLCANVHWVGKGFPAARSSTTDVVAARESTATGITGPCRSGWPAVMTKCDEVC